MKNKLPFNEEFQVGKHGIGWLDRDFVTPFKDTDVISVFTPTYQTLKRDMIDAEIESELKPGICTTGDVLAFLDNAPQECKDGRANIFYFASFVVDVYWGGDVWRVSTWSRGDGDWRAGRRVFSPATAKPSAACPTTSIPEELIINGAMYRRV